MAKVLSNPIETEKFPVNFDDQGRISSETGYTKQLILKNKVLTNGDIEVINADTGVSLGFVRNGTAGFEPISGASPPQLEAKLNTIAINTIAKNANERLVDPKYPEKFSVDEANAFTGHITNNTGNPTINPNTLGPVTISPFKTSARPDFGVARYPSNRKTDQDCILFEFKKYNSVTLNPATPAASLKRTNQVIKGSITLPIQTGITDSNNVQWGEDRLNPIEVAGATIGINAIKESDDFGQLGKNLLLGAEQTLKQVYTQGGEVRDALIAYFTGQAIGNQNLLSRINGAVLNPNLELLFQGPQLRNFNFNFQLTPRSKDDVEQIRFIIRRFKQAMAVQRTDSELFLSAPYVFGIKYVFAKNNSDDPNPYLPLIKDCALTNFSVDYTPDGSYMTYVDGSMTSYRLTMQFQELTPIYEDDYAADGNKDTNIGY